MWKRYEGAERLVHGLRWSREHARGRDCKGRVQVSVVAVQLRLRQLESLARRLFDEPYKLTEVARLAGEWFTRHFEAVAVRGIGVFDTLKAVSKLVIKSLS